MSKPTNIFTLMATCFPLGQMPKAPGTWGSLPGLLVGVGIFNLSQINGQLHPYVFATLLLLILAGFSWWVIHKTEALWQSHDDKSIVIDEVAGQAIPLAFFSPSWQLVLAAFVLFRFFDISKPLFIGWADKKVHGSFGTLLDDLFAGMVVLGLFVLDSMTMQWLP